MPKAIAEADTFLKKKLLGSTDLADSEKILVKKGQEFFVTEYNPDRNQHLLMTLASPFPALDGKSQLQKVYAYDPHIKIEGEDLNKLIKLPVKYCSQLDNDQAIFGAGWRQCNTTSNTMLADYLLSGALTTMAKAQGFPEPESV